MLSSVSSFFFLLGLIVALKLLGVTAIPVVIQVL